MDSTDYKILELLQKNARISMKKIGQKVGLTAPAVSDRIKKLENNDTILGYTAVVNKEKLGKKVKALVEISMNAENRKRFYSLVEAEPTIIECYHVTGPCCMVVKCLCQDMKKLDELIDRIQEYGETNTLLVLSCPIKKQVVL